MKKDSKNLDAQVDLISFISLLSVCICFLLLTAIWIHIGSLNVKQAVGGQSAAETEKQPVIWARMLKKNKIAFQVQDAPNALPAKLRKAVVEVVQKGEKTDYSQLAKHMSAVQAKVPSLSTALILPRAETLYEDVIELMDELKKNGIVSLGVSPL